ncbi:NUDIX hydrolase [Burkholderia sp. BCC1972]|uniref:NUDIX hydrolase n=1 Tax=Burkholderia sp. BCC1972 TaxID=2817438 RepID=UPI002ABE8DDD|nr:NUDIX hydrolase [Burkholderia sp. BCC1972]
MTSAYAVLYDQDGWFLIAKRRMASFYFGDGHTGVAYPRGEPFPKYKGPGKYALPGGAKKTGEDTQTAAAREFLEETGVNLPPHTTITHTFAYTDNGIEKSYEAAYFKTANPGDVDSTVTIISALSLRQAEIIIENIKENGWKDKVGYSKIVDFVKRNKIDQWPYDNELEDPDVWNIKQSKYWSTVKSWDGDPTIGWYYTVLEYLRTNILESPE